MLHVSSKLVRELCKTKNILSRILIILENLHREQNKREEERKRPEPPPKWQIVAISWLQDQPPQNTQKRRGLPNLTKVKKVVNLLNKTRSIGQYTTSMLHQKESTHYSHGLLHIRL